MKSIATILFVFCVSNLFAQQYQALSSTSLANPKGDNNYQQKGNYSIDNNDKRDAYVGLWRYEQDGILFELKIDKIDKKFSTKDVDPDGRVTYGHQAAVIFKYKLVKNGVTLFDNLNYTVVSKKYFSYASNFQNKYLLGNILDATANATVVVMINRLDTTNPEKIYFNLKSDFYSLNETREKGSRVPFFSIPANGIEMVKIQ